MPIGKPKIQDADADKIAAHFFPDGNEPAVIVYGVRGYFLNSIGKSGENDFNVYDDAMLVRVNGELIATFNANTDPSKPGQGKAILKPGIYQFYRGLHKGRIKAFRAYPEGVKLPVIRNQGTRLIESTAQYINIHDGGLTDTWSEGCQTLPGAKAASQWGDQFAEFRNLVYDKLDRYSVRAGTVAGKPVSLLTYVLLDERTMRQILGAVK